jgi:serine/threonine protein kinase
MHPDRWNRIKEILDVSLRLEPGERDAYLTRVCEADTDLRSEVESLIEAHDDAGDIFEAPVMPEPVDTLIGARLGAYEIVECIGSGGMGSVYRAIRADEVFHKEVAVKVVRRGLDLDHVVRQFLRERRITAILEHPNIATLMDGGATPDGLPYFVMEFIRGKPIDIYCDEAELTIRERLELFATVCAAVQFAHERGVIHRDIKPGNILVNSNGHPKLLDFGIAKILNPEVLPGRDSIVTAAPAMTPGYASPEQLMGAPISAASDVYSLGVLLYELLAGERPKQQKTGLWGMGDAVDPEPPSRVAPNRGLAIDLDKIVLMAMHREPDQRYQSAGQLEQDIRRFLNALPVRARKDTLRYRLSKLVRRQKVAVASVSVAVGVFAIVVLISLLRDRLNESGAQPVTTPLTSMPGREVQPYFSPDGRKIVYSWSSENAEKPDIYIQALDGSPPVRLTTDRAEDLSPVWSPNGSRVAWLRTGAAETAVFVSPAVPGAVQTKIAEVFPVGVEGVGRHLDWSPDGNHLAVADKANRDQPFHLALINVKDSSKKK